MEETWVEWIKRATHIAEEAAAKMKITDWVIEQRKRKWRWAGHLLRRADGRWSTKMMLWMPAEGHRHVGHPRKRWLDSIMACLGTKSLPYIREKAQGREEWEELTLAFAGRRW
eukprot:2247836-Karenia_brevis.AAC.1